MKISHFVVSAVTGAAAAAAMAAPALAAEPVDAENALGSITEDAGSTLNAATSQAGLHWGLGTEGAEQMGDTDGANSSSQFGSAYGDATFHDKHSTLVASYGAPLIHVDARCVDAMGGIGGYGNGVLGNSAKCNLNDVNQIDDSNGLLG